MLLAWRVGTKGSRGIFGNRLKLADSGNALPYSGDANRWCEIGTGLKRMQKGKATIADIDQELPEVLQGFLLRCPQCGQVWLVGSMRNSNRYQCKSCDHSFAFTRTQSAQIIQIEAE